jgi:hypothetical protein
MKTLKQVFVIFILLPLFFFACKQEPKEDRDKKNIGIDDYKTDFVRDQLLILFKPEATSDQRKLLIDELLRSGGNARKCHKCEDAFVLIEQEGIHRYIENHAERLISNPTSTKAVAEDSIAYYSVNFKGHSPENNAKENESGFSFRVPTINNEDKAEEIVVAVLDTGVDKGVFPDAYLWKNSAENISNGCYGDDQDGWNFLGSGSANIQDDHAYRHGTLVNSYILEQFLNSKRSVALMNIKVLDENGSGDLFGLICGLHYAKDHGADIINISLGFYEYDYQNGNVHPYLQDLITNQLRKAGILVVAAAGNRIPDNDQVFLSVFPGLNPRDIGQHRFYPAHLSLADGAAENNLLSVTTVGVKEGRVSPSQNYSPAHVDLGIGADFVRQDSSYRFMLPFSNINSGDIAGSSFAAAIATGRIGAFLPKVVMTDIPVLTKTKLIGAIDQQIPFGILTPSQGVQVQENRYLTRN